MMKILQITSVLILILSFVGCADYYYEITQVGFTTGYIASTGEPIIDDDFQDVILK